LATQRELVDEKTTATPRDLSMELEKEVTVVITKTELRKADDVDVDFLRDGVRLLAQALMDVEVGEQIGAEHGERTPERTAQRNGYRQRRWDTRVGTVDLAIPRLRTGSYFPSILDALRRGGAGAVRGGGAVLRRGGLDPPGGRHRPPDGHRGDLQSQVSRIHAQRTGRRDRHGEGSGRWVIATSPQPNPLAHRGREERALTEVLRNAIAELEHMPG
jgi:hypothetical protein